MKGGQKGHWEKKTESPRSTTLENKVCRLDGAFVFERFKRLFFGLKKKFNYKKKDGKMKRDERSKTETAD